MKIRNGFVSNSSSSSFICNMNKLDVIEKNVINYSIIEDENIVKNLKEKNELLVDDKLILTSFLSDGWYDDIWCDNEIYEYCEGGHGEPYDEEDYIEYENEVWILKSDLETNSNQVTYQERIANENNGDIGSCEIKEFKEPEGKMKVFLGGTCNGSSWRDKLIPKLEIDYFNPVVDDWTEECYQEELKQREECDVCLYVITSDMTGVYSIAEVIHDSIKHPSKTMFAFLTDGFDEDQIKSLNKVGEMVFNNGGVWVASSLNKLALCLNERGNNFSN